MKSFLTAETPDTEILFQNYGVAIYKAQALEGCLQIILLAAELQGRVKFDRREDLRIKDNDEDLLSACIGPMVKVLKGSSPKNNDYVQLLDGAHKARNFLVHRFFLEGGVDLLNETGRRALNDKLGAIYLKIVQALMASEGLRDALFKEWGISKEYMQRKADEFRRLANDQ